MMIKRRNMAVQVLLFIITLSFYSIYWFYVTAQEMSRALKRNDEVGLWTVLLFLPFVSVYSVYKYGELYEQFSQKGVDKWVCLLLWLFFPPAIWFIVQRRLNDIADGKMQLPPPAIT